MNFKYSRTLRDKRKRYQLWKTTDGKCAICGIDLTNGWEADHTIPWRMTKRTNPFEMQPLCPDCNRRKG